MRTIARYEILREIGRGGIAIVYAARQPDLDRQVALVPRGSTRSFTRSAHESSDV
jgi:serine/threonine protein kinase